jgi:hypothetical protein
VGRTEFEDRRYGNSLIQGFIDTPDYEVINLFVSPIFTEYLFYFGQGTLTVDQLSCIYSSLLNTPTVRSRDEVLPASSLLSFKRQGNEVELGKYPDRKVVGSLFS